LNVANIYADVCLRVRVLISFLSHAKRFKRGIMKKSDFGAFVLMVGLSAIGISGLVLTSTEKGIAQGQGMQNMPGMNMSKSKPAAQKKRTAKKKLAKKHNMAKMPGMYMSGMKMSGMH